MDPKQQRENLEQQQFASYHRFLDKLGYKPGVAAPADIQLVAAQLLLATDAAEMKNAVSMFGTKLDVIAQALNRPR